MTPEQRYFFDLSGYLHLENALGGEELEKAQEAAERYVGTPPERLPPGFGHSKNTGKEGWFTYSNGFAFDKALESLTMHPAIWPIICELTQDRPRFLRGTLLVNRRMEGTRLHSAREDYGWPSTRYAVHDGHIFCDAPVVFPYLTDVYPGDGGLIVVPGSHKSAFERPLDLFYPDNKITAEIPPGIVNICPRAGDVVIISELLTHGTLPWKPANRDRRTLVLRYLPQYYGNTINLPEEIKARLSPETLELMEVASYNHLKKIVKARKNAA